MGCIMGDPSGDGRDPVEVLAEEFLERRRRGEAPSLNEYIERYPHLADDIRELFPALVLLADIDPRPGELNCPPVGAAVPEALPMPRQLGDYRIIRRIGQGGMGVVYEAEQVSLGRHVALKVLPHKLLLDARQKRRFEREAKAAARLHHTNIVPVFGVGQQDGVPYYAMQFIPGLGLDAVIEELKRVWPVGPGSAPHFPSATPERTGTAGAASAGDVAQSLLTGRFEPAAEGDSSVTPDGRPAEGPVPPVARPEAPPGEPRPDGPAPFASSGNLPGPSRDGRTSRVRKHTYWQSVARIGSQVADALGYAHNQGVLHRDIKPSNLLLDRHGTVWVTDFGLAKVFGPGGEAGDDLTQTGDLLGTLRYLSPEAFEGKADARSDVYGLGLTLYELLALRPAFDEADRRRLLKQVAGAEPARLERLNPAIPRDLATVVHKALERDPAHRYPTAADVAADLQDFIDDEPIKARPLGLRERGWRWCRHNPAVAGLTASVFLLLTTLVVVAAVALVKTSLALKREAELLRTAESERESARTSEHRAQEEAEWSRRVLYDADMRLAAEFWGSPDGDARAVLSLLEAHRPRPGQKDLRDFAWHYQWRLCHGPLTLPDHSGTPSVAVAADGQLITFDEARVLRRFDRAGGAVVGTWRLAPVEGVGGHWDLSPDGSLLALGTGEGKVSLYDTATGRERPFLTGKPTVLDLSFDPDGQMLATVHADGKARVWEVRTGKQFTTFVLTGTSFEECVLGPRGESLLLRGQPDNSQVSVYRAGEEAPLVRGLDTSLGSAACSPDGRWLVAGDSIQVIVWEAATGEVAARLRVQAGGVYSMAFSPDGTRLGMGGRDGLVTVWDMNTFQRVSQIKGHTARINSLRFAPDGKSLISGAADGTARLWELANPEGPQIILPPGGEPAPALAYSPDGHWLAVAGRPTRLWDARTGRPAQELAPSVRVAFSPDSQTLALGDMDGRVTLFDVATGRAGRTWEARPGETDRNRKAVGSLAFSPDGRLLAAGFGWAQWWEDDHEQVARVWDVASGEEVQALAHNNSVPALAFSPDGSVLATASHEGVVRLWSVDRWQVLRTLAGPKGKEPSDAIAFSPNGDLLATGSNDYAVLLWDARSGQLLRRLQGHSYTAVSLDFSPDGQTLASASWDRTVKLWDVVSGRELRTLTGHPNWAQGVAFAPDGRALASCDQSGGALLWDTLTRRQREQAGPR
jgi:WD40 repeat protein